MYLQLGWRNIWRNPRRTGVILTAVIVGVWSMIFLGALMRGVADQMVRNGIATLTGHIQIHLKGFRDDPVVENSITEIGPVLSALKAGLPAGSRWTARVRVNAVAANARHSGGVTLVGINPEKEAGLSFIGDAVVKGAYLKYDDKYGLLAGQALLEKFETRLGHKLVLMSQDTQRNIASRAFRISGVYRAETEATEKRYVFVTLSAAQQMLKLAKGVSEFSILLPDRRQVERVAARLRAALPADIYEVQTWRELLPLVIAILKMHDWFIFLWFLVVFIAMGFGIVNTTLMAVFERIREFGLLKALGMKPMGIIKEVLTESFFLLFLGMAVGNTLGFLTCLGLARTGIDLSALAEGVEFVGLSRIIYPMIESRDVMLANGVVFFLGLLVSVYPAVMAGRISPVEAMAHN